MRTKQIISAALTGILSLTLLTGCGTDTAVTNRVKLNPNNPVSLTVWHYYNGAQQAAFDELVSEFNATVGKEQGIYVEGYSQGSVADLEQAVADAVSEKVGSEALPDIFSTYSDTAYAAQQSGKLADLNKYFTKEEQAAYVDDYIREGYFTDDGALYLFPVAKSTEILMMNVTDWQPFAEATGCTYDDLKTIEGVTSVAKKYYEWTDAQTPDIPRDGKAFYGRDSMSNYFIIGMKQLGIDIFDVENGVATIRAEKEQIRRLWDNYYIPYINGYFARLGKFRSDDVKTGDLLAYTGSSSSAMYFPSQVMTDTEAKTIDYVVLPAPILEGAANINVQQGASMAVTKSDELHEYASCVFLRWFTKKENNLRFVCDSAYLPVTKEANTLTALDEIIQRKGLTVNSKAYDTLTSILGSFTDITFYSTKCFVNGYETRKILDYNLSDKAMADQAAIDAAILAGADPDVIIAEYSSDEAFDAWYTAFVELLNATANK